VQTCQQPGCKADPLFSFFPLGDDTEMSKVILSTIVAALVCVASANAEGISNKTLGSMGLGGMKIMSDSDAMVVRGKGFDGVCDTCSRTEPGTRAVGNSFATIILANCPDCVLIGGAAHSENAYTASGPYYSAGTNFSEAGAAYTTIESVDVGGAVTTLTKSTSARVFAGGYSTARGF
jgi:hypothetical protein